MKVGCQRHVPVPGTYCIGGWVGLGAGLDKCGKSLPQTGFDTLDLRARGELLYRLSYPGPATYGSKYILKCKTVTTFCV